MGKRINVRARGKGGPRFRVPSHRYAGKVSYNLSAGLKSGIVLDIIHDQGRNAPLTVIQFEDGSKRFHIAPEGIKVGDVINYLNGFNIGSVLPVKDIPEGQKIFGIETYPGSGPKICRSSGCFATVTGKVKSMIRISLSSGKIKEINENCMATIGMPAGSGRTIKPWVKAGKKYLAMKARGRLYPTVSGSKQNPVDHPFGGKTKPGKPKSVSRHAPPGRKVGSISPRRMGKKKR